jgi:hypothetical protein
MNELASKEEKQQKGSKSFIIKEKRPEIHIYNGPKII